MDLFERFIAWVMSLFSHGGGTLPIELGPANPPPQSDGGGGGGTVGNRHLVTDPENISAHFFSTGSPAWANQVYHIGGKTYKGIHGGTDFRAPHGTPVYAPYAMRIIAIGYYADEGRRGYYVIGTLPDGAEYYSGHLNNIAVKRGEQIESGTQLGTTWDFWNEQGRPHTHVQIKIRGEVTDPEGYFRSH